MDRLLGFSLPNARRGRLLRTLGIEQLEARMLLSGTSPTTVNDSYALVEDMTLNVAAAGVLSNDTDPEFDPLTAILVAGPSDGSLTLNTDGSFDYTPNAGFNGNDSFTYKANDSTSDGNTATVTITVSAVNDAPVATDDAYSVNEDTTLNINAEAGTQSGLIAWWQFDEGAGSQTALDSVGGYVAQLGSTAGVDADDPTWNGVGQRGTDALHFDASKSQDAMTTTAFTGPTIGTVSFWINPDLTPSGRTRIFGLGGDWEVRHESSGILTFDLNDEGGGTFITSGPIMPGQWTHVVSVFNATTDTFKVYLNGALDNSGSVSLTFETPNNLSFGTRTGSLENWTGVLDDFRVYDRELSASETAGLWSSGVMLNDVDADGDPLSAVLVTGPANGSLTLHADGSFIYTPNAGFNGTDSFTYKSNDGTVDGNTATVTITVTAQNDTPITLDDSYATNEDTTLNVAANGVLANDTDPDSDPLTAILVAGPSNGTLTLNADGSFEYTPDANYYGTDSFIYKAYDGTIGGNAATVTITVTAQNDSPITIDDDYATNEDTTLNIAANGVLTNDFDTDSDPLTAVLVSGPSYGSLTLNADGSFEYTPDANYYGTDSFIYKANDGTIDGNSTTVTITINDVAENVDFPPVFDGDNPVSVPISPSDPSPNRSQLAITPSPGRNIGLPSGPGQSDDRGDRITLPNESHGSDTQSNDQTNESTTPKSATPDPNSKNTDSSPNPNDSSANNGNSRSDSNPESDTSVIATDSGNLAQQNSLRVSSQSRNNILASVFAKDSVLFSRLDNMKNEIDNAFRSPEAQAFFVTTVTVVAGYVLYDIRKVSLLSALFSSVPHWKRFDPLVVLQSLSSKRAKEKGNDAKTLLGLVDEHSIA